MNRKSTEKLRLDRRLAGRRNWISASDLAKALEALPDVSGKIAADDDEASSASAPADAPESAGGAEPPIG